MLFFAGITAPPLVGVRAQPKPKLRIGCASPGGSRDDRATGFTALFERLSELGYVEGRNLEVDFDFAPGHEFLAAYNAFVRRGADLLLAIGSDIPLLAARVAAAGRVPIVMLATDYDPLEAGYVESLARPGGNLTGVFMRQPEVAAKQVELAHELFPSDRRLIIWIDPAVRQQADAALRAAQSLGLDVQLLDDFQAGTFQIEAVLQRIQSFGSPPTLLPGSPWMRLYRDMICRMALERRIPLIAPQREFVEAGALISYGVRLDDAYRQVADYISRIAGGTKPAHLPIEQPTRFELSVNARTARELGIGLPPIILARADAVIE